MLSCLPHIWLFVYAPCTYCSLFMLFLRCSLSIALSYAPPFPIYHELRDYPISPLPSHFAFQKTALSLPFCTPSPYRFPVHNTIYPSNCFRRPAGPESDMIPLHPQIPISL